MDKLHKQVQDVKELGVQAIITQILDIVDDALAAQKEE